jgi:hypothetical protein
VAAEAGFNAGAALILVDRVRRDTALPEAERMFAQRLSELASTAPALALERLREQAERVLPQLPHSEVHMDLAKAITADTYLRYLAVPEVRDAFTTVADFIAFLSAQTDRTAFLTSSVAPGPAIVAWERSWITEAAWLEPLNGNQIRAALELPRPPPFVLLRFGASALKEAGCGIRQPCSLDTVFAPHLEWREEGLVSGFPEYVDGDLPSTACTRVEWRP